MAGRMYEGSFVGNDAGVGSGKRWRRLMVAGVGGGSASWGDDGREVWYTNTATQVWYTNTAPEKDHRQVIGEFEGWS
jgi:hypothetical protein